MLNIKMSLRVNMSQDMVELDSLPHKISLSETLDRSRCGYDLKVQGNSCGETYILE